MVLVKHREQVISSQLMTTPKCVVEGAVTFPNLMALHHLTSDFNITLEVYALCTHEPRQVNMKKVTKHILDSKQKCVQFDYWFVYGSDASFILKLR